MKSFRFGLLCLVSVGLTITAGCGRESRPKQQQAETTAVREESGQDKTGTGTAASELRETKTPLAGSGSGVRPSNDVLRTDPQGRKWLGDIPYDVWFDDPLSVVGKGIESSRRGSSGDASTDLGGMVEAGKKAVPSEAAVASTDATSKMEQEAPADGWKRLVSADALDAEVKSIRNNLAAALQSVGKYNAKYKDVQTMGSTLAAIGAIAAEHPDDVRWKSSALYMREIGTAIESSADKVGSDAYRATKKSYDALIGLLDGNTPSGIEEPPARDGFSEFIDRGGLMKRIDIGFQWLKKEITSEKALQSNAAKAEHEAAIMAALGRVIAGNDYSSADEADYAAHAKSFVDGAVELTRAGAAGEMPAFVEARDRVQKKCDECHSAYRF